MVSLGDKNRSYMIFNKKTSKHSANLHRSDTNIPMNDFRSASRGQPCDRNGFVENLYAVASFPTVHSGVLNPADETPPGLIRRR